MLAERKQIRLQVQKALTSVDCPEAALGIVLTNLVRNAINYSGSGDVISWSWIKPYRWSDQAGMDQQELSYMLQPFERGQ